MRTVVLSEHDLARSRAAYTEGRAPTVLPYGVEALEERGHVLAAGGDPTSPLGRKLRDVALHRMGFPIDRAVRSVPLVAGADLVLALLERQGYAAAWARRLHLWPYAHRPLVLWTCWLADDLARMSPDRRRALVSTLRQVPLITHLARSETSILLDAGLSAEQLFPVTYGSAMDFYTPDAAVDRDLDIVAIGQDRGRDYGTLFEAVRGTGMRVDIWCKPGNLHDLEVPENVTIHAPVDHLAYRALLRRAKVVAVPTIELAYPTGSSVTLEASACGAAVVTTDTTSMREYVTDAESGRLLPEGDADAWRATLSALLADPAERVRLGAGARRNVETTHNTRAMWLGLDDVMRERGIIGDRR